jgi:hypothetical protein
MGINSELIEGASRFFGRASRARKARQEEKNRMAEDLFLNEHRRIMDSAAERKELAKRKRKKARESQRIEKMRYDAAVAIAVAVISSPRPLPITAIARNAVEIAKALVDGIKVDAAEPKKTSVSIASGGAGGTGLFLDIEQARADLARYDAAQFYLDVVSIADEIHKRHNMTVGQLKAVVTEFDMASARTEDTKP